MLPTCYQPTGIYSSFPQFQRPAAAYDPLNFKPVQEPTLNKIPQKRKKSVIPKILAVSAVAIGVIWGLPAIRVGKYGGDFETKPLVNLFTTPSQKHPELDPLRSKFVEVADFIDKNIRSKAAKFLYDNLFKYNERHAAQKLARR